MKKISSFRGVLPFRASLRCAVAVSVVMSMLNLVVLATSSPDTVQSVIGSIRVRGTVRINGQSAIAGQTLFANSNVVTSTASESLIVLSNLARLSLSADTDVTVDSSKAILSGSLRSGSVRGRVPAGVFLDFTTNDLSIKTDGTEPVVFSIETSECGGSNISLSAGQVEARIAGRPVTIKAGETLSTGSAPAAGQSFLNRDKRIGLFVAIGIAVGTLLAATLGNNPEDQEEPGSFGGCVIVPSGENSSGCR